MPKKGIINNGYRKKRDTKITTILTIFLVVLFILSSANAIHTYLATNSYSTSLTIAEKISEELFVDNEFTQVYTKSYYRNSIIHINITVLPHSNSSVEIICSGFYATDFSPALTNATLTPGESFSESYTFIKGVANGIAYGIRCTTDSNATVIWSYEVLFSARPEGFIGMEFLFICGALLLSTMTLVLLTKRKHNKKND